MHRRFYNWLRFIVLSLFTMVSSITYAYDFDVDGLCYNIISSDQVEVTYRNPDGGSYSGNLNIPETVIYNGIVYHVTKIGRCAFEDCSGLTGSLTIPNSVVTIDNYAFYGCSGFTGSLTLPNSITSIGQYAFYKCSFTGALNIPNSITKINICTFYGCSGFTGALNIPNTVTNIEDNAFDSCSGIGALTIPNSIKVVGQLAFFNCSGLENVYSNIKTPFYINYNTFQFISSSAILHIPQGTKEAYDQFDSWVCNFSKVIDDIENDTPQITTYTLSITAAGNGSASYGGENIRGATKTYTVNEGTSVTISFTPDNGYRIKSLVVNNTTVTASTSYTVTVNANTTVSVEFEAIPPTTYTLSIKATGNGSASYDGTSVRGTTKSFTVNEGTKATITFTPDDGYQIKSLKVNNVAVTASTSYTATVNSDTSIEVEFEAKPVDPDIPKTYTLSIRAKGNGFATYNGETIRATTKTYTLEEGTKVSMIFTPDEGNQIKSLRVNDEYQTVTDKYEGTITADISIKIDFEEIPVDPDDPDNPDDPDTPEPPVTYTLSIKAVGNGAATYGEEVIRDNTSTFTLDEGTTGTITFTPDEDYHIKSLMVNGSAISIDTSYSFTMYSDTSVEVEFEETVVISKFSVDGLNYEVNSLEDHTITLGAGDYGLVLEVPEKVTYNDEEWTVTGIVYDALVGSEELAAVIWNSGTAFYAKVTNPNLLLYVKDEAYAPVNIKNVVVNSYASSITLTEAMSGNNFYCPVVFTAQSIEYTHNYLMKSGLNASRGWETIALPFDVQKISHSSKGEIVPFAKWTSNGSAKPFWLYELSGNGFVEAESIKANTPYIISMPNNEAYPGEYQLTGRVTFSAENVEVKKSDDVQTATFGNNTFMPSYTNLGSEAGYYALNVNNDYEYYRGSANEGSMFILNLRKVHPFEAYMTSTSGTRSIDISEGMTTGIRGIEEIGSLDKAIKVYDLSGRLIKTNTTMEAIRQELPAGLYIVNNRKMIIK